MTTKLAKEILESLSTGSSEERIAFTERVSPTKMEVLGITMPYLKEVLKNFLPIAKELSQEESEELLQELVSCGVFEMQLFAYCWLDKDKKLLKNLKRDTLLGLKGKLDNWVSVDYYGTLVIGPMWFRGELMLDDIKKFQGSRDFWLRRLALCACIGWDRVITKKEQNNPHYKEIVLNALSDRHPKIIQALSWVLRFHIPRKRGEVISIVELNRQHIADKVLREVHNKLDTGLKN